MYLMVVTWAATVPAISAIDGRNIISTIMLPDTFLWGWADRTHRGAGIGPGRKVGDLAAIHR